MLSVIDYFLPLMSNVLTQLAPVAFVIFCVTYALDFIFDAAYGRRRRP